MPPRKPKNERNTENIVRDELRRHGYYDESNDIRVEEQRSTIEAVRRALRNASKTGKSGAGAPEFIVSDPEVPDFLLIFEGKADTKDHASAEVQGLLDGTLPADPTDETEMLEAVKRANKYAVDGALHYARFLSRDYNVIALGVSGETKRGSKVSAYLWSRGAERPQVLTTRAGKPVENIIPWADFVDHASVDPTVIERRLSDLMGFSRELHDFMRDHAKLTESEKPLLVSGTLIALMNRAFAKSYGEYSPEELQAAWMETIKGELKKAKIPQAKTESMAQPYSGIAVHAELGRSTPAYPKGVLHEMIRMLDEKVRPFVTVYHDYDIVGQFYGEFLRYTGGDKKALGIVLTPRHVCELFSLLADLDKDSVVLDTCTGTGAFPISAMHRMFQDAETEPEKERIKSAGLVAVEQQPHMYALAASNMLLRGDGKANLYQGSCFDEAITAALKTHQADVGMINPPYAQGDAALHELRFVQHLLECLAQDGLAFAIVPMSCATAPHPLKEELMKAHTLEAVMTMPVELFYPVGVNTCIMVWRAHRPHAKSRRATWFGYWRDDGHVKTKNRGRIDLHGRWLAIRDRWVKMYRDRDEHAGESVKKAVTHTDEWVAEAYMQTDYSVITEDAFNAVLRDYAMFHMTGGMVVEEAGDAEGVAE